MTPGVRGAPLVEKVDEAMRFDDRIAGLLVSAVRAGATFDEACRRAGVNVHTGRTWLRNGRRDPAGRYGRLAREVDGHRQTRRDAERAADGPLALEEAELLLATAARQGSVSALRLWFDRNAQAPAGSVSLDELDELAAARQRRRSA